MRTLFLTGMLLITLIPSQSMAGLCSPGTVVGDDCLGIGFEGCCHDGGVRWCESGKLCELSCAGKPACGWKENAGIYDCGVVPSADPSCARPYSCFQGGCEPAYEDQGCCGCPCEDCVCDQDPYCCTVSWDAVCVSMCQECGGCGSPDGCIPAPSAGCQGCSCETCVCEIDPYCCSGKWDLACASLCVSACGGMCEICEPDCDAQECGSDGCGGLCGVCPSGYDCQGGDCVPECIPSCQNRECGTDGCTGSCGTCQADEECNPYGQCVPLPCEPVCDGVECGDDGCGGSCGSCGEMEGCEGGFCVPVTCPPQCDGKECGPDGCGGFCGFCPPGKICDEGLGKCIGYCPPNCTGKTCGDDGCGGSCGTCEAGLDCLDGQCKAPCFTNCTGKVCGDDACGGSCGTCPEATPYCVNGLCLAECTPSCAGKECGDDGCGGDCGECPIPEWYCQSGMCVPFCQPNCLIPPDYFVYKECGWDGCPGEGVCGVCQPGNKCSVGWVCVEEKCSCDLKECGVPAEGCPSCGECPEGKVCDLETELDPETHICEACVPNCIKEDGITPKECGDDGCGGTCGQCPPGWSCDEDPMDGDAFLWQCEPCTPNCTGKECGDDGCGGSCGQCPADQQCDEVLGLCTMCVAQCMIPPDNMMPMECGPNACPPGCMDEGLGPCSSPTDCAAGQQCNAMTGQCVACGSCGICPNGYMCDTSKTDDPEVYVCEQCTPDCGGKECGPNGCGGMCGGCQIGWECNDQGICVKPCSPMCLNKQCGPNNCPAGCINMGTEDCSPSGECPEGLQCEPTSWKCVPCEGTCGLCSEGQMCGPDYICIPAPTDPCEDKECGDDGQGGTCGECDATSTCVAGQCMPLAEGAETDIVTQPDTAPQPDTVINPPQDTGGMPQCPPGYKWLYNKCVPEEPVEEEGDGGGGGCATTTGAPLPLALLLLALLGLALRARKQFS